MEGFSSNLNDTFTSTRGCAAPMFFPQHILPLLPLYNAQWWGYESLTAIALVQYNKHLMFFSRNTQKEWVPFSRNSLFLDVSFILVCMCQFHLSILLYLHKQSLKMGYIGVTLSAVICGVNNFHMSYAIGIKPI